MTFAEQFYTGARKLSAATVKLVLALFSAYQAGRITLTEWQHLTVTALVGANTGATVLGDHAATQALHSFDVLPVGLELPAGEAERLTKAITTVSESLNTPTTETADPAGEVAMKLERIATNEPVNAFQQATIQAFDQHEVVTGYRRGVRPEACELCHWLAKTHLDPLGYIYPTNQPMHRHTGCTCTPIPVTTTRKATA